MMREADPPMRPGVRLGPYVLQGPLGQGGMGQVFAAVHEHIGQAVAIKILSGADSRAAQVRLIQEGRALAQLTHPGIVRVLTCDCTAEGLVYLVMERVDGVTLRAWLRERPGPQPWAQVLVLGTQIAAALAAAHQRGIVHRDLTPANLMLSPGAAPRVTVLDFGIAKVAAPGINVGEHTLVETGDAGFLGTPGYAAPEQHGGGARADRVDVYALGVILHECLSGAPPFRGEPIEVLALARSAAPPLLDRTIPAPLARLIAAMLSRDPAQRPSMQQVYDTLYALVVGPARGWRVALSASVLVTVVTLVVLVTAGVGLLLSQRSKLTRPAGLPALDSQREALLQQVLFDTQRWLEDADWSLAQLPNTLHERKRVLARYDSTLNALDAEASARPAVVRSAIEIRHRSGDLALYHGPLFAAAEDYRVALQQIERALYRAPQDPELRLLHALNHSKHGKVAAALGQTEAAARHYAASVDLLRQTFGVHPADPEVRRVLSVSLQEAGELALREGRAAAPALREAEALLADSSDDYDGECRAEASLWLAKALAGDPPARLTVESPAAEAAAAEAALQRARADQRQRAMRQPANLRFRATLGALLSGLAALHLAQGRLSEAGREGSEALDLARAVSQADATDKRYALLRCELLAQEARLALRQRDPARAARAREECRLLADAFALRDPSDVRFPASVAHFPALGRRLKPAAPAAAPAGTPYRGHGRAPGRRRGPAPAPPPR